MREGWAARRVGLLSCEPLWMMWRGGSKAFDNLWIQQEGMLRHDSRTCLCQCLFTFEE